MAETEIPQDVRELAERYAGRPMFAEVRFTVANAMADAIMADRAARAPDRDALASAQPETKGLEWFKWDKRDAGGSAETIIGRYHVWTHHEAEGKWFYRLTMTGLGPTVINGECVDEREGDYQAVDSRGKSVQ